MKKIIHLSDIHLGYQDLTERFIHLARTVAFLKEPATDYAIVITGDTVDSASPEHYQTATDVFDLLKHAGFDVLVAPGNHDYGCGLYALRKWSKVFKQTFYGDPDTTFPRLDILPAPGREDAVAFIGLDSMEEELNYTDFLFSNGELGNDQLGRLRHMLDSPQVMACAKRVVYLHHHPFDPLPFNSLKDSDELGRVIANKVDCLLYGHNHQGKVTNGKWGIPRCYDGGSATHKDGAKGYHRVIDLSRPPREDYDGSFL